MILHPCHQQQHPWKQLFDFCGPHYIRRRAYASQLFFVALPLSAHRRHRDRRQIQVEPSSPLSLTSCDLKEACGICYDTIKPIPGLVNFVAAVAYHFWLNLQPWERPCSGALYNTYSCKMQWYAMLYVTNKMYRARQKGFPRLCVTPWAHRGVMQPKRNLLPGPVCLYACCFYIN